MTHGEIKEPQQSGCEMKICRETFGYYSKERGFFWRWRGPCFLASCFLTSSFDRILDLTEHEFIYIPVPNIYFYPYMVMALVYE